MSIYLGIDLGTTGLKAVLVRTDGQIAGIGYHTYPIETPKPGYAEQNPENWLRAMTAATRAALTNAAISPESVRGIGLSGQMHGTVLLDSKGALLHPAIIWCDQRSAEQSLYLRESIGRKTLGQWTQNPISAGFQACTLMWLIERMPELYRQTAHVLLPKDYLRYRLTGRIATEATDASGTLLFDCAQSDWSEDMLRSIGIDRIILPGANHLPADVAGTLFREIADALCLPEGIPVAFGGADQPMQAIGNGLLHPGEGSITLGTGGQILIPTHSPDYDPLLRTHTFCHAEKNRWYVMGATLNACLSYNWFLEKVLHTTDFKTMDAKAAQASPEGAPYFLPYLTGERTPHMNPSAQGIFWGLGLSHQRADMVRAVLEGVAFSLVDAMQVIEALGHHAQRFVLSGGGAVSPIWRQMIADALDRPIYPSQTEEQAAMGAAICAMVAANAYPSLETACNAIVTRATQPVLPCRENVEIYRERHAVFQSIYKANEPLWRK